MTSNPTRRAAAAAALVAGVLAVPPVALLPAAAIGPVPSPMPGCAPVGVTGGEWRSYGHDLANARHQDRERHIAHADVPLLAPAWTFSSVRAGGAGDFTGTPIVADGCLYVGSNRGWVFAVNADTGALVWKAQVPDGGAVNSTVAVAEGRVYATVSRAVALTGCTPPPCGGPYLVAFDQATGALAWSSPALDTQVGADIYSSPVYFDGVLIAGVSGGAAEIGDETDRYAFQGSVTFTDAATGALVAKTWTIHPPNTPADDYAGAAVWSTAAVDPVAKVAYVGTGNPFRPQAEHAHANAIVKLDVDRGSPTFGAILGSGKGTLDEYVPGFSDLPCEDFPGNNPPYYPQGIGSCGDLDLDFGASPNLFADSTGRRLVGAGQKSGVYHAFDADTMAPVWSVPLGPPTLVGGIVGSTAYDGRSLYGPVTPGGYVWSVSSDGALRWVSPTADGAHYANASTVANGIMYTVDLKGFLDAYDARNGVPLAHRPLVVGADTGTDPVLSWAGVAVARNTVYAAVGVSSLANGFVVALRPGGDGSPLPGVDDLPEPPPDSPVPAIVAGPGSTFTTYATPVMVATRGGPLSFANNDLPPHDVVSVETGADGQPLFRSDVVGIGEITPVRGMDRVQSGRTYEFFCSIHPGMRGRLAVL